MKETIRCCIACILPCGALDVIRIVHANGRVEEISGTVSAGEIMRAYPKHVLRRPPPTCHVDGGDCPAPRSSAVSASDQAMILPPTAELQRGKIYFLMPVTTSSSSAAATEKRRRRKKEAEKKNNNYHHNHNHNHNHNNDNFNYNNNNCSSSSSSSRSNDKTRDKMMVLLNERYLSEILSEKASTQRDRRRGRVGVWRPHLESISESDF